MMIAEIAAERAAAAAVDGNGSVFILVMRLGDIEIKSADVEPVGWRE